MAATEATRGVYRRLKTSMQTAVRLLIMAEKALLKDRDIKVVDAAIKEEIPENENTEDET